MLSALVYAVSALFIVLPGVYVVVEETHFPWDAQQVVNGIYLGNYYAALSKQGLKAHNVTTMVSLAPIPLRSACDNHMVILASDRSYQDLYNVFQETFAFIDDAVTRGETVLVHCMGGVSRSATILAAYLMKKHNLTDSQAIKLIAKKRPIVNPNHGFRSQLSCYKNALRDGATCKIFGGKVAKVVTCASGAPCAGADEIGL